MSFIYHLFILRKFESVLFTASPNELFPMVEILLTFFFQIYHIHIFLLHNFFFLFEIHLKHIYYNLLIIWHYKKSTVFLELLLLLFYKALCHFCRSAKMSTSSTSLYVFLRHNHIFDKTLFSLLLSNMVKKKTKKSGNNYLSFVPVSLANSKWQSSLAYG